MTLKRRLSKLLTQMGRLRPKLPWGGGAWVGGVVEGGGSMPFTLKLWTFDAQSKHDYSTD